MKNNYFKLFLSLALISIPSVAFAEIHSTQSLSGVYYNVSGNTSRSFYPENEADYLYEGTFDFSKIPLKDWEAFGNIEYRFTDDKLVDRQDFSIERMYMGLKGAGKEILVGDFYQNFSEYSLGNALKGVKFSLGDEKTSRLIVVAEWILPAGRIYGRPARMILRRAGMFGERAWRMICLMKN